ncbi:MAG: bifunctional folylpolyglutamate synthase/dihydrofolate synthase [Deltaproteobacteria bacterium]
MTYDEARTYLEGFIDYEKKTAAHYRTAFKIERVKKLLGNIGDPQEAFKVVHVAGTKGKGSTSCFIAHILRANGLRVGLYTSPHLNDLRERIRVLDGSHATGGDLSGMILKHEFAEVIAGIRPQIDFFRRSFQNYGALTFFEILTAAALAYFREKKVDVAVLETGLGGRLDATNAAPSHVAVVTPISYDHEKILGATMAEIAFEKAGILKPENARTAQKVGVAVCAAQEKPVMQVLRRRAKSAGCLLFEMGKDFSCKKLSSCLSGQDFYYSGLSRESRFLSTRMLGAHQLTNASLAVAACEALGMHGVGVTTEAMSRGLAEAYWPGRLEVIRTRPFIILDGAHNRESAGCLAAFLGREFKKMRTWFVLGVSQDKDIRGVIQELEPLADKIILTRSANPRAADPAVLHREYLHKEPHAVTASVEEALRIAARDSLPDDLIVVTGSLFVVGEAKALWQG